MIAPVGEASWGEEELLGAGLRSAAAWPAFAAELGRGGRLESPTAAAAPCTSPSTATRRPSCAAAVDCSSAGSGFEARELLGSAARELEPGLASVVDAGTRRRARLRSIRGPCSPRCARPRQQAGVRFRDGTVTTVDPAAAASRVTAASRCERSRCLLAAGAWAGARGLLPRRPRLPVRPVKGEILRLRAEAGRDALRADHRRRALLLVPRESGEMVLGATVEERGFDLRVTAGGVHELLREAYRALPELAELELVETAAGLRPGSPDNAPIGRAGSPTAPHHRRRRPLPQRRPARPDDRRRRRRGVRGRRAPAELAGTRRRSGSAAAIAKGPGG